MVDVVLQTVFNIATVVAVVDVVDNVLIVVAVAVVYINSTRVYSQTYSTVYGYIINSIHRLPDGFSCKKHSKPNQNLRAEYRTLRRSPDC